MITVLRRFPATFVYVATLVAASLLVAVAGRVGTAVGTLASTGYEEASPITGSGLRSRRCSLFRADSRTTARQPAT